jgi:SAM-dependent methyltransferase
MRFAHEFAATNKYPILDAGCGFGRNAFALARKGLDVVAVDRDPARLSTLVKLAPSFFARFATESSPGCIYTVCADLASSTWPFCREAFSGVTCVHFPKYDLFDAFRYSLRRGGLLFLETFGGQGLNYLDLPRAGHLRHLLSCDHDVIFYHERAVGPAGSKAVSVKLLARSR